MHVVKATKLVPIEFDVAWGRYQKGDTGGVRPADVALILAGKIGKLAAIPEGVETEEVKDQDILVDLSQSVGKSKEELNRDRMGAVEIPDGWTGLHHLQRIKIAADIRGAKVDSVELADATIQDELVRRGEAVARFAVGANATGNLANQGDGGQNIPPQSAVLASVPAAKPREPAGKTTSSTGTGAAAPTPPAKL